VSPRRARRAQASRATARRGPAGTYFVPVPLGLEGLPLGDELLPGVVEVLPLGGVVLVAGGVEGEVVLGGDADGVRSPGRSPTRSPPPSVQAVSSPAPRARAQRPVSTFVIFGASSLWGLRERLAKRCNGHAAIPS
jgi:hypothetical protein